VQRYGHGILEHLNLENEIVQPTGTFTPTTHWWEQVSLPAFLKRNGSPLLLNFCNTAPSNYTNQIVTVHDMAVFENPNWFSKAFANYYQLLIPKICRNARHIVTVSDFSKAEIIRHLKVDADKISVIPSAVDNHLTKLKPSVVKSLLNTRYVLMVGSPDDRKNMAFVIEHAGHMLQQLGYGLVVAGNKRHNLKSKSLNLHQVRWVIDANDHQLAWLYSNSSLVIHPSLYEGFSLIPHEARAFGKPTLLSDIAVHRDLNREASTYFKPRDPKHLRSQLELALHAGPGEIKSTSFIESAQLWKALIQKINT